MLNTICTRKEKTWEILFFEIYKMVLIIFKSENCSYTGDPPNHLICDILRKYYCSANMKILTVKEINNWNTKSTYTTHISELQQ